MTDDGPGDDGSAGEEPMTDGDRSTDACDPSVTVVVVSYFSADSLERCLDSVVSQTGVDARALVVDNGAPEVPADERTADGSDAAEPRARTGAEALCREFDEVRYVASDANVGFGAAVNRGFALAESDYLATLNPDARFEDGALRRLVDHLEDPSAGARRPATDGAAFAAPKILRGDDPDRISTCGLVNHFTGLSFNRAADLPADHPAWSRERDLGSLSGCAFATTPSAWDRVGGFDEEMFLYKDDVDLAWACQCHGERIRFVPDARVVHDYERDLDGFKLYHVERNRLLLLAKYLPASAAVVLAPSLVLAELLAWAMAASLGVDGLSAKLRAYGILFDSDVRTIRERGAEFRERFPDALDGLAVAIPWRELRRTGVVPDSPLVSLGGRFLDRIFRANAALYRRVIGPSDA